MEKKLCPVCNEIQDCTVLEEGVLNYQYRCSVCSKAFERPTYFNKIGGIGATILGIGIGVYKGYQKFGKNDKNKLT